MVHFSSTSLSLTHLIPILRACKSILSDTRLVQTILNCVSPYTDTTLVFGTVWPHVKHIQAKQGLKLAFPYARIWNTMWTYHMNLLVHPPVQTLLAHTYYTTHIFSHHKGRGGLRPPRAPPNPSPKATQNAHHRHIHIYVPPDAYIWHWQHTEVFQHDIEKVMSKDGATHTLKFEFILTNDPL